MKIKLTRDIAARLLKAIQTGELETADFPELTDTVNFFQVPADFQQLTPEERTFEMNRLKAAPIE